MQKQGLTTLALQKFKKSFWGVSSFWFIVFLAFISVFAYVLAPDNSQFANQMHLSIHSKQPGFTVNMLVVPNTLSNEQSFLNRFFLEAKTLPLKFLSQLMNLSPIKLNIWNMLQKDLKV